ncbi:MAG: hypothetical protein QF486_03510 [Candidatus Woesearchaeota archaeon]|jgi:hypothetical protein|nr:hypothetical protein [Candidatus Woesearchaeota archaeon]MDP7198663.1 hypothetical protein [Candidatus Woesearchaeota archaeon]MDP7647145.1 hypothetical protein [Candidatus Woesearchaeota archaeon]
MGSEKYPKIIVHFEERNFKKGDRVRAHFNGGWFPGIVVKKYQKRTEGPHYVLIRTDTRVDDDPDALLDGFGLEGRVGESKTHFEHESLGGDERYNRTYKREMTAKEKSAFDFVPF